MSLLPDNLKGYCLPAELVFVYYSEHYFNSTALPTTISFIPPVDPSSDISNGAYQAGATVSRVFVTPVLPAAVQWFVELDSLDSTSKLINWISLNHPEWQPEIGALLPASILGFSIL